MKYDAVMRDSSKSGGLGLYAPVQKREGRLHDGGGLLLSAVAAIGVNNGGPWSTTLYKESVHFQASYFCRSSFEYPMAIGGGICIIDCSNLTTLKCPSAIPHCDRISLYGSVYWSISSFAVLVPSDIYLHSLSDVEEHLKGHFEPSPYRFILG